MINQLIQGWVPEPRGSFGTVHAEGDSLPLPPVDSWVLKLNDMVWNIFPRALKDRRWAEFKTGQLQIVWRLLDNPETSLSCTVYKGAVGMLLGVRNPHSKANEVMKIITR